MRNSIFGSRKSRLKNRATARRNSGNCPSQSRRLKVEKLESRRVLATYVVDTINDDANDDFTSLPEALLLANSDPFSKDRIEFASSLEGATIPVVSELEVRGAVDIVGLGADKLTLSGGGQNRVFLIDDLLNDVESDVLISGLEIADAAASFPGGAISNVEKLTIEDSVFVDNVANVGGGVLGVLGSATTIIRRSRFENNRSVQDVGGAISIIGEGPLHIFDSVFVGNTAMSVGAVSSLQGDVEIVRSTFRGNTAETLNGGAVFIGGAGFVSESTFVDNAALQGDAGAVWHSNSEGQTLTVENSTFIGNKGLGASTIIGINAAITNSTLVGNSSANDGGVVGVGLSGTEIQLSHTIIAGNTGGDLVATASTDSDYNVIGDATTSGGITDGQNGNRVGVDWLTVVSNDGSNATLADNGGPTDTIDLLPGSLALNGGNPNAVSGENGIPQTDQRGFDRVVERIDIGAVEVNSSSDVEIDWAYPEDIVFGTALSSAQLNATSGGVAGQFVYSPDLGTVLDAGEGQLLFVEFIPEDSSKYNSAQASVDINVLQAESDVDWQTPSSITFGTPLGGQQLNASSSLQGVFTYNPEAGTVLDAGTHVLSVSFLPDDSNYAVQTASVELIVDKATPAITWSDPASISYLTPLSETQLNATASVEGVFAYSPGLGEVLPVGNDQELSVVFVPANGDNYTEASESVEIDVMPSLDFGDAPSAVQSGFASSYPTLLVDDGARHFAIGAVLGVLADVEVDGQPETEANGDDSLGSDEDGIVFTSSILSLNSASVASLEAASTAVAKLDAWIDFNRDGDWLDEGEQILESYDLDTGENQISFSVPANSQAGMSFARFRISSEGSLTPFGLAQDGEVEDHSVLIETEDSAAVSMVGDADVLIDGNDLIVKQGEFTLFRAAAAELTQLEIQGSDLGETLRVDGLLPPLHWKANEGYDRVLVAESSSLDLAANDFQGVEEIAFDGVMDGMLQFDPEVIQMMAPDDGILLIKHNEAQQVDPGEGWEIQGPVIREGEFVHVFGTQSVRVEILNTRAFRNPLESNDTNRDNSLSPIDALLVINDLNRNGVRALTTPDSLVSDQFVYLDTNGDNFVSPLDALIVINALNLSADGEGESLEYVGSSHDLLSASLLAYLDMQEERRRRIWE